MKKWIRMIALLSAVGMVAIGCGSDAESPAPTTAAPTASAVDAGPLRVAIVAPSASDDLAFSQSMVDSVNALDRDIDLSITDGTFIIEDAAAAIRGYAEDGHDVVIAHGTQFGASLVEIAPDFPDVTFAWGTASDTQGLDNVFAYAPAADEGGYVNGWIASSLTETGVIGVVGPIEAGDAVAYINGFEAGALAGGAAEVNITYTGSFGDVALAAEAAEAHLSNNADVLTGTAQMVVGAVGVAADNDIPWFGTQANQTSLAPDLVVASQVYHWEVVLEEMLRLRDSGVVGGQAFEINLANGGLVIEFNDAFVLPAGVRDEADRLIEGIGTGAVDISASATTAAPAMSGLDVDAVLAADLSDCAAAPSGDPIRVGMAMDFSDVVGFVDIPGSKVVPYVAELINCAGGINGSPVEVRVAEVGDDAALATQELLDWGAHFLIGPPFADFALPILQTTGGQVPLFVAASTEPTLADASINSYLVTFDDYGMSEAAARWALDQGITRAIVFTEGAGIPYTGVNPDAFIAEFEANGGEVVSTQTYVWAADTDFSAQVNEIAGLSQNNEVVFSAALAFQVTALRGQLEGQGLDGLTYVGTDALDATGIQVEANNEGIAHTPHVSISAGDRVDTLLAGYEAAKGEALESRGFMPLYVDSMFVGIQGILDCGCADPAGIGEAVKQISGFEGLSGEIT
ncbi:MAG: BMP family ABC transporter substrate-binding protein, partial [Acidimicrobiales bacterium]|nr:BMP family ABC transporter substrate-binding protein [Acidimicrobiales bacterium]